MNLKLLPPEITLKQFTRSLFNERKIKNKTNQCECVQGTFDGDKIGRVGTKGLALRITKQCP